jgi:hypothetical protein
MIRQGQSHRLRAGSIDTAIALLMTAVIVNNTAARGVYHVHLTRRRHVDADDRAAHLAQAHARTAESLRRRGGHLPDLVVAGGRARRNDTAGRNSNLFGAAFSSLQPRLHRPVRREGTHGPRVRGIPHDTGIKGFGGKHREDDHSAKRHRTNPRLDRDHTAELHKRAEQ